MHVVLFNLYLFQNLRAKIVSVKCEENRKKISRWTRPKKKWQLDRNCLIFQWKISSFTIFGVQTIEIGNKIIPGLRKHLNGMTFGFSFSGFFSLSECLPLIFTSADKHIIKAITRLLFKVFCSMVFKRNTKQRHKNNRNYKFHLIDVPMFVRLRWVSFIFFLPWLFVIVCQVVFFLFDSRTESINFQVDVKSICPAYVQSKYIEAWVNKNKIVWCLQIKVKWSDWWR